MLDRYLEDLRRDLAHRLPEADLQARLAEAESHLREGIEGRIELGLSPEDAEREAIGSFGATKTVSAWVGCERRGRVRGFRTACLVVAAFWTALSLVTVVPDAATGPLIVTFVAVHAAYLWASGRLMRPQLGFPVAVMATGWACAVHRGVYQGAPQWEELPGLAARTLGPVGTSMFATYALLHLLAWFIGRSIRHGGQPLRLGRVVR